MEKTVKKLLVATGLVASAAVALLPLTSYAVETGANSEYFCDPSATSSNPCARAEQTGGSTQVTVNVDTILAIDAVSQTCAGENDTCVNTGKDPDGNDIKAIQAYPGMVRTGTLTTSVRSAKPFTVSLSAADPYLKGYDGGELTGFVIPSSNLIDGDHNGWGVQKDGAYANVTTQPTVFFTSDVPYDTAANVNFKVGVSVKDNVPQGLYSTEVTITAATIGTN